jgi:beta-lactamase regulating signal transducer with metallopeptidase domain
MTHFASWVSPDVMRTLGWALVHFLWQGLALAALLSAAMAMCRSAAARYALAVGALVLMLAAPVVTFGILWSGRANASSSLAQPISLSALPHILAQRPAVSAPAGATVVPNNGAPNSPARADALLWFVELWFAGVIILSLRTAGGVLLIERMRRKDAKPVSAKLHELCVAVQQQLGLSRAIRYCESSLLDAPAVIGWFRPAVLLPLTALTGLSDEQLQAVIAHELAHIRRLDNFVNLFQIVVETLLFYHPAVWWVSKRIRAERENCCDDAAISVCSDAVEYARALALMAEWRSAPALAMAVNRGPLAARVARLVGVGRNRNGVRSAGIAASFVCLAGAVLAANAFVGVAHTAFASALPAHAVNFTEPVNSGAQEVATSAALSVATAARSAVATTRDAAHANAEAAASTAREMVHASAQSMVHSMVTTVASVMSPEQDQAPATQAQTPKTSYIEAMKAAGFDNLTADQLIALKIQGVTPEYVKGLRDLGLKPDVDELIGLRVQGVTPEYIRSMHDAGVSIDTEKLIGMKVQGVTPDYVREMHQFGVDPNAHELIGMKVQGVTTDYIKAMRAAGVNVTPDTVIGMRVQGITPEYVEQMHQLGIDPKGHELIGMKVQGVTPEYIKEMRAAGIEVDARSAIGMRVQGVTPQYVKEMHDLGLKTETRDLIGMRVQGVTPEYVRDIRATGLDPKGDQIIGMRVQGVTADYIKGLQAAGFKDLTVHMVLAAKIEGLTPEFIEDARKHGFQNLDLEKLIELKRAGIF